LPSLYVFSDGRDTELIWQADSVEVPSDPSLEFVESGRDRVDRASVESALTEFVNGVLSRVKGAADERLDAVAGTWSTILSASSSEADFCTVVGRLGLDPYQLAEVPEALLDFIEREIDNPHRPILKDLTETSEPNEVMEQLQWVRRTTSELALGAGCPDPSWRDVQGAAAVAANEGYRLANLTRLRAGLSPVDPVESVTDFARHGVGISLHTSDSNHLSGKHVQALVGWSRDGSVTLAGPRPPRSDSQRFLESRGLYQAMFGCDQSERLLTRAYTWDQQSSRAFAAELLAPRAALVARVKGTADEDDLAKLSEDFGVSRRVIEHQLTNAGVAILGSDF